MVHQYQLNGYNIVLDTCSGAIHVVDEVAYDIIALYPDHTADEIVTAMMEKYGAEQLDEERIDQAARYADGIIAQYEEISPRGAQELIGVSGTPTTIAGIKLALKEYQPERIQGLKLTLPEIHSAAKRLLGASLAERKSITGMPPERADILQYGSLILWRFMTLYGYEQLTVSDDDSLKGYIKYMILKGGITE